MEDGIIVERRVITERTANRDKRISRTRIRGKSEHGKLAKNRGNNNYGDESYDELGFLREHWVETPT